MGDLVAENKSSKLDDIMGAFRAAPTAKDHPQRRLVGTQLVEAGTEGEGKGESEAEEEGGNVETKREPAEAQ